MTTLAGLRARLRVVLGDEGPAGYLWPDGVLNRHLDDAVRAYSRDLPREMVAAITTVAGQAEYDLPGDLAEVIRLEMEEDGAGGGVPLQEGGDGGDTGYRVWAGKLILTPAPSAVRTVAVSYLAGHAPLLSDADVATVPARDEDLLVADAAAKALEGLATEEAKRRRFEDRSGRSAAAMADGFRKEFVAGIAARRSRVRAGRLVAR